MLWVLMLMSTHNIGFYEDLRKIIFQISSNTHLISSCVISVAFYFTFKLRYFKIEQHFDIKFDEKSFCGGNLYLVGSNRFF